MFCNFISYLQNLGKSKYLNIVTMIMDDKRLNVIYILYFSVVEVHYLSEWSLSLTHLLAIYS